jgi:hypothetical protein
MPIQFVKNVQFSKLIKAEGRLREFNFRKTGAGVEEKCSVDTVDDRGNRIIFSMLRENGAWKLSSTLLPKWICQYEVQLHDAIEDEISHPQ